jgi:hypothetical protein
MGLLQGVQPAVIGHLKFTKQVQGDVLLHINSSNSTIIGKRAHTAEDVWNIT